ncbi:pectin lyase fold/virulence factor [Phakopsora pachyrhizi]|uniref:pectinesterase n=1 Tax=Phakopsora pachyrhizi TaxID=170000 RepID=A0AAV0BHY2_PHAPC|nr:pectin lyase fold/virulence factor [Phakopsora pachyrhizi]
MVEAKILVVISSLLFFSFLSANPASLHGRDLANSRSPPPGALVVRNQGTRVGEFPTINDAVRELENKKGPQYIFIHSGTYNEAVHIKYKSALTIQGYSENPSSYEDNQVTVIKPTVASEAGSDSKSSVIWAKVDDFKMYNINAINSYGAGKDKQAVAVTADGDRQIYKGCKFDSYQDTLYVRSTASYFDRCSISGGVDFIFGAGSAWFEKCTIGIKPSPNNGISTITAQKRERGGNSWFVFNGCKVVGLGNLKIGSVFLGRPWSEYASVAFQFCFLPDLINPEGWMEWQPSDPKTQHVEFLEYRNSGAGSLGQRKYGTQARRAFTIDEVLGSVSC